MLRGDFLHSLHSGSHTPTTSQNDFVVVSLSLLADTMRDGTLIMFSSDLVFLSLTRVSGVIVMKGKKEEKVRKKKK